ncbi:4-fold beta flower protein [Sulfurovum sp.]|uniref:4-fold beta flower protein n=1 Tax=Sulfurovum sp. TaxID=1969726 RepID=UPI002A366FE3|nr:hypothetical protein [Sulfurovum sp.]MDD2452156.1 hypothetical protein [Sulfurovum sp.]MDY0403701.1 hypothetical protein [Sulfurovum sp.]
MKLNFYDCNGTPYAYSEDGKTLYTFGGKPVAYIDVHDIYAFAGSHLGYFEEGSIWDHSGNMLLFTDMSRFGRGPLKPKKSLRSLKTLKTRKPLKKLKARRPVKPLKSRCWSVSSPKEIFLGL